MINKKIPGKVIREEIKEVVESMNVKQVDEVLSDEQSTRFTKVEGTDHLFVRELENDNLYLYTGDDPLIEKITYPVEVGIIIPKVAFTLIGAKKIESLFNDLLENLNC